MFSDQEIAELRGDKPSMKLPVLFSGWGGKYSTVAIFKVCPEYIGKRKIVLFFNDNYLLETNRNVQSDDGSGFAVDTILPNVLGEAGGIIIMHADPKEVKEAIRIEQENRNTKDIGGEYSIAFYSCGEFDLTIAAIDEDNNCEELYTRSFCCK